MQGYRDEIVISGAPDVIIKHLGSPTIAFPAFISALTTLRYLIEVGPSPKSVWKLIPLASTALLSKPKLCHLPVLSLLASVFENSTPQDLAEIPAHFFENLDLALLSLLEPDTTGEILGKGIRLLGQLFAKSPRMRASLIKAGAIPKLALLPYDTLVLWAFTAIFAVGSPSQIKACFAAKLHELSLQYINHSECDSDARLQSFCFIVLAIRKLDSEDFQRLVSAPLFIQAYTRCLRHQDHQIASLAGKGLYRVIGHGQQLANLQSASSELPLPCESPPSNPFWDYLYFKCTNSLDHARDTPAIGLEDFTDLLLKFGEHIAV